MTHYFPEKKKLDLNKAKPGTDWHIFAGVLFLTEMHRISHVFYLNSVSVTLSLLSKPLCRSCVASFMIKTGEAYEGFGKILHMFQHYRLEYKKLDLVLIIDASI